MQPFDINSLPEEIRLWIEEKIESGLYDSPEAVVETAILALEFYELNQELRVGLDQLDRGEYTEYDEAGLKELRDRICEEGERRLRERRSA